MASQSPHHHPHCCCCGRPVTWTPHDADAPAPTRQQPTGLDSAPTIGTPAASDAAAEPDGGVRLPPIPNPVCQDCATTATTADGTPIDPPPTDSAADLQPTAPESGANPVFVDGITCWRIGTAERWQLARDALGCDSATAFLRRHTDADGQPLRWFGTDHHGSPQQVRIEPSGVIDLLHFVERFRPGAAFALETAHSASPIKPPVVDIRRLPTEERSQRDTPQLSALTVEPAPRRVVVSIAAVDAVAVAPQPTVSPPDQDAASTHLDRYAQLAAAAPSVIDVNGLASVLQTATGHPRMTAVRTLESVLAATAAPGLAVLPSLVDCLAAGRLSTLYALRSLTHIAAVYPEPVAEEVAPVIDLVTANGRLISTAATRLLLRVAEHDPAAVIDAVPAFGSLLEPSPTRARRQALAAVGLLADPHPEAVRPLVPQLCSLLETDDTAYRISSTAALGRVTAAYPAAASPAVPMLITHVDAESPELRANAVGVLADIARQFPADVAPYTDALAARLTDDDPTVRSNTAGAFARIAAVKPHRVTPFTDALIDLLTDDWTRSRVHACWALGRCEATTAVAALTECRHADPDESVRQRAAWALERIE